MKIYLVKNDLSAPQLRESNLCKIVLFEILSHDKYDVSPSKYENYAYIVLNQKKNLGNFCMSRRLFISTVIVKWKILLKQYIYINIYKVNQKKIPTFENSWHEENFTVLNDSNSS